MTLREYFNTLIASNAAAYTSRQDFLSDVVLNGCATGIVAELIFHHDTDAVFTAHEAELIEWADYTGFDAYCAELSNWDSFLGLHSAANRCMLVWAAFEDYCTHLVE